VATFVDEAPSPDLTHLIDAIRKLVAAVFDVNRGVAVRHIPAVDVGDA
jgi:hypothetical protein